ncbi:putative NADPH-quinone reductase (modulator of drug activity B) [Caulobacter sp. AP07]|uniref:NAD(P)H-dependent oxidoreductase n=1 Tax=Caulobacter sp. AP07 TaxID=1144304 RepID=UPI0002720734|nr:NAD(P)H-dependent oxidoreductase [Caulobacter sp. AP07]EJL27319.1 putative NADPH-quinone reductase (modulator of drug activity B) [Caulobacter sp. AP07]
MSRKILIINGHPDASAERLAAALSDAYARGAARSGREVRRLDLGALLFPPVITGLELEGEPPEAIRQAQDLITWCDHMVLVFPLWIGGPPALLKSFFEQICRYGFSFEKDSHKPLLGGRSARIIVTMIIPAFVFHLMFAQGVKWLRRGVLWTSGFKPIRTLALGNVFAADRARWLEKVEALGAAGA